MGLRKRHRKTGNRAPYAELGRLAVTPAVSADGLLARLSVSDLWAKLHQVHSEPVTDGGWYLCSGEGSCTASIDLPMDVAHDLQRALTVYLEEAYEYVSLSDLKPPPLEALGTICEDCHFSPKRLRLVHLVLMETSEGDGCNLSKAEIAKTIGAGARGIDAIIKEVLETGWIARSPQGKNGRMLLLPSLALLRLVHSKGRAKLRLVNTEPN